MRYYRVIPPVALLATLTACTQHTPSFNPTPHPTRPGQVVVVAGSPGNYDPPRDGEYAIKSSAQSEGGLAVDPTTGQIYLRVLSGGERIIERIERDGTITTLRPKNTGDQLAISSGTLWIMSSYKGLRLSRMSLTTLAETEVLDAQGGRPIQVLSPAGDAASTHEVGELRKFWPDSRLAMRGDGVPIITARSGDLYEVVGVGKVKRWRPPGYAAAKAKLAGRAQLRPVAVLPDGEHGLLILARTGILRVGNGHSKVVRIHMREHGLPDWTAALPLKDGSTLLLGGTSSLEPVPRPALVRPDGALEILSLGYRRECGKFDGSTASLASADLRSIVKVSDSDYAAADARCGRIYRFRPPVGLEGTPHVR